MPLLSKALVALGTAVSQPRGSPAMPDDGKQEKKTSGWYQDEGLHPLHKCSEKGECAMEVAASNSEGSSAGLGAVEAGSMKEYPQAQRRAAR